MPRPATTRVITITVPFDVQRCSPNQRYHWRTRNKHNADAKSAAWAAWVEAGQPTMPRANVRITLRRARKLDQDNAMACCKPVIDGLFKDAVTPDDKPEYVWFAPVEQETGKQWKGREEVVFEIEEVA